MFDQSLRGVSVVVAGAGLAGLSAAHALLQREAEVTVFEARDRIGGRVWTARQGFVGGQHAEAGADIIDDGHTTLRRLAQEFGLTLVPILEGGFAFVRRRPDSPTGVSEPDARAWQALTASLAPLASTYRLNERRWDSPVAEALGRTSLAMWLHTTHASEDARAMARGLRGFFLADPDDLSLLPVVEAFAGGEAAGVERRFRVAGGNSRLAEALATGLGDRLHLNAEVVAVTQDAGRVRVKLAEGRRHAEVAADFAVIAVPAPLARAIEWTPHLPDAQHDAIARLKYGFATRTLLQFDRRFWQHPEQGRAYGTDLAIGAVWDGNEEQPGAPGILSLLAGGSMSNATQSLVSRGGVEAIVQELAWMGVDTARLLATTSVRWEDDPWARGGYAYFDPAYAPAWRQWLARPFNHVLFAGEHTSLEWQGYMNGAVESGLRAAAEVGLLAG